MAKKFWIPVVFLTGLAFFGFFFFGIRQVQTARGIEQEWRSLPGPAPALAATHRLEIIPLYDEASSSEQFASGHGVSYLVRTDQATVLVDAGNRAGADEVPPFEQNMRALGIAWEEIDAVVITHSHPDHTGGLPAWRANTIELGEIPAAAGGPAVYTPAPLAYPGSVAGAEPVLVGADVATTGAMPYREVFPLSLRQPRGVEQALLVNVAGKGLVLISGCGHPELEKMVARATSMYRLPLAGVVGGLHYGDADARAVKAQIQFLQSFRPQLVALSPHDSGPKALAAFQAGFPAAYQSIAVGSPIWFP